MFIDKQLDFQSKPIHLLIDADFYIYYAARCYEEVEYWGNDIVTAKCNIKLAKAKIKSMINEIKDYTGASKITMCLSCPTEETFRTAINPDYKKNRFKKLRPIGYKAIKDFIRDYYKALELPKLEADDIVGILATEPQDKEHRIIISNDKDLDTLATPRINPDKLDQGIIHFSKQEAEKHLYSQILSGDSVDGYPGCPGIGPVTAKRLLDSTPRDQWIPMVVRQYEAKKKTKADVLLNARMAFILDWNHYNWETGEITHIFNKGL